MNIIGGPASQLLAGRVCVSSGYNLLISEFRKFPDGELYTRIIDDIGEKVTIIQSTVTDTDLVALLQLIDACSEASKVNVVIPYLGYARQDKRFKIGEPITPPATEPSIAC